MQSKELPRKDSSGKDDREYDWNVYQTIKPEQDNAWNNSSNARQRNGERMCQKNLLMIVFLKMEHWPTLSFLL